LLDEARLAAAITPEKRKGKKRPRPIITLAAASIARSCAMELCTCGPRSIFWTRRCSAPSSCRCSPWRAQSCKTPRAGCTMRTAQPAGRQPGSANLQRTLRPRTSWCASTACQRTPLVLSRSRSIACAHADGCCARHAAVHGARRARIHPVDAALRHFPSARRLVLWEILTVLRLFQGREPIVHSEELLSHAHPAACSSRAWRDKSPIRSSGACPRANPDERFANYGATGRGGSTPPPGLSVTAGRRAVADPCRSSSPRAPSARAPHPPS